MSLRHGLSYCKVRFYCSFYADRLYLWIKILNSYTGMNLCPEYIDTKPKRTALNLYVAISRLMYDMQKCILTFLQRQANLMMCEVGAAYPLSLRFC